MTQGWHMDEPGQTGEDEHSDHIELGRPRPESHELMTAKQLVYAYADARSDEDKEYAAAEAESFLYSLGDDADIAVLLVMLQLPAGGVASQVVEMVQERLAERAPQVIPALLRTVLDHDGRADTNAAAVLNELPVREFALGLIGALAGAAEDSVKKSAAESLVSLGRPAASEILDALADHDVRRWIVWASGAGDAATDADVMRRIIAASVADPQ
jgi:hypothetical protein